MPTPLERSVAASIDAPVGALRWVPRLFDGLWALGSSPRAIANWLGDAGIGPGHHVLDLACGKGAVSVELARRLGCRTRGIDAFEPFLRDARSLAAARGVERLCRFEHGDVRAFRPPRRAAAAIMVGLLPIDEACPLLRGHVPPGGLYLVDDCVSVGPGPIAPDAPYTRAEARALIEDLGDRVIRQRVWTTAQSASAELRIFEHLERGVRRIARAEPAARGPLSELLARQRAAAAELSGTLRPAMWLVRRGPGRRGTYAP